MVSPPEAPRRIRLLPVVLLPLLAFLVTVPLWIHGPSCGHDFGFHLQSWMDAAAQIRHGRLLPRWAFSPAFNAGEPRFLFYPPLSWLLGSLLLLLLPAAILPATFTWIALTGAAAAMYALARRYTSANGALLAAALYIGNPYILFTAFERTAYAELLAAAWMPLLLRAALAPQLSALSLALPLALLWLTNAPAAVMGTYTFVLIVLIRLFQGWRAQRHLRQPLTQAAAGLTLGLALPAFYLIPAAWERRYVQIAMAIIPNMRVEDNFLFGHTGYGPHDQVLHTASLVALTLVAFTALALALASLNRRRTRVPHPLPTEERASHSPKPTPNPLPVLTFLAVLITLLLWHVTLPLWHLVPELAFLQFPWRLLAVLGCLFGLAAALALRNRRIPLALAVLVAPAWLIAATALASPTFRQACDVYDPPATRLQRFLTHHGVGPTDEYTPTDADNDQLRWDDPAFWLIPGPHPDPNTPGPGTVPNPAATITDYDQPPPMDQTVSGQAPTHLHLHLDHPAELVLNLRDYPTWQVTLNGHPDPHHLGRDDGLLALALPAGDDTVDIRWHTLPDMWGGDAVSLLALAAAIALRLRSRRISP